MNIRADVAASLVQPGQFNTLPSGWTVYASDRNADGFFHGIFISASRPDRLWVYTAEQARPVSL